MTTEAPATSAPPAPTGKRSFVPILIGVVVVVLLVAGAAYFLLKDDSSSGSAASGEVPPKLAKVLYTAWQRQDRTEAGTVASPDAVTAIFAIPVGQGTGLIFGGCAKAGDTPLPKVCTFSRPGGELKMTVSNVNGTRTVTAVTLGPAGTTPTG